MKTYAVFTLGTGIWPTVGAIIIVAYLWEIWLFAVGLDEATDMFQAASTDKWYCFINSPQDKDTV